MTQTFKKHEKQKVAVRLLGAFMYTMLYGGARSGKTFILLRAIIIRACKYESRHVVLRLKFNALKASVILQTLPKVLKLCFPQLPSFDSMMNKTDWYLQLPNGSQIWFGGLDEGDRTEKILGTEYSTVYFVECSQIPWDSINLALTRLAENVGLSIRAYFDCNPPGKKHWTHKVFIEGIDPDTGEPLPHWEMMYCNLLINPEDNMENLSEAYMDILRSRPKRYRQRFLHGLYLTDVEGALWTDRMIIQARLLEHGEPIKTIIAVDPAVTNNPRSDETGIIPCSVDDMGRGIVHDDWSVKASTGTWAQRVVNCYHQYEANYVVAETNQGGDLVVDAIHNIDRSIKVVKVHASKGKFARAEPVAQLYEEGQEIVAHEKEMPELEAELTEWVPMDSKESPNRLDALVWGLSYLKVKKSVRVHAG